MLPPHDVHALELYFGPTIGEQSPFGGMLERASTMHRDSANEVTARPDPVYTPACGGPLVCSRRAHVLCPGGTRERASGQTFGARPTRLPSQRLQEHF